MPFSRAINFANGATKGVHGNYFHKMTLAELFTIHVNLHVIARVSLIFGETNFMEVPKICKIYGPQKEHPMVASLTSSSYIAITILLCPKDTLATTYKMM